MHQGGAAREANMSTETLYLPRIERLFLAFGEFTERLQEMEPDTARLFPEAMEIATRWTVAGEEPDDIAAEMVDAFFAMLEAVAREMRERDE
jgi:hypothetical protein